VVNPDTRVELHALALLIEDDEYVVGRVATDEFVALPKIGGRVIECLQAEQSATLQEIQAQLAVEYDADVDLIAFVRDLLDLDFVKTIDGYPMSSSKEIRPSLPWVQPHHVRWLFSRPAQGSYSALLVLALITLVTHNGLIPRYQDFFWSTATSIVIFGNTAIVLTNLMVHEFAHLVAARSLGVTAHISLGTRLQYLVIQTNVTGLWALPRRQRYRVYLAGIVWDTLVIAIAFLLLAYIPLPLLARSLLHSLIFLNFLGILWQFHLYMRTDLYFVALNFFHCHNLFEDAVAYLRYSIKQFWLRSVCRGAPVDSVNPLDLLEAHERYKVMVYAGLVTIGSSVALVVFFLYELPLLLELFAQAGVSVSRGFMLSQPLRLLDGSVTLLIEGGLQVLFFVTLLKKRKRQN